MAVYLVNGESLSDVADAIRAKTGGTSELIFPDEFVSEIGSISGGCDEYEFHSVEFTCVSTTYPPNIISTFIKECTTWRYYPIGTSNTQTNTIGIGNCYFGSSVSMAAADSLNTITTDLGVSLAGHASPSQFIVNDQTYDATRARSNLNSIPAGTYKLEWYGLAV